MNGIILDGRLLLAREALDELGEYAGKEKDWLNILWGEFLENSHLMQEFMYYVDHHSFSDRFDCCGYHMTDLYVFQMSRYNLTHDTGKNTEECNKEKIALESFHAMASMVKNPDKFLAKLFEGPGKDRY